MKYIESSDRPEELFRLDRDPGELWNVADELRAPAAALRAELQRWKASRRPIAPADPASRVTPDQRERLKALGYIE
jgi:hypothetical protein